MTSSVKQACGVRLGAFCATMLVGGLLTLGGVSAHPTACLVGFDVAPELTAAVSAEDMAGYVRNLVRRVNVIFGDVLTPIEIAWIRPIDLGVYSTSSDTLAYYDMVASANTSLYDSDFACVRVLLASRKFPSNHNGIAQIGRACYPGFAAVFNVDPAVARAGDYAGAWALQDDAVRTTAHEIAHTYGLHHSDNPFDFMYPVAVVSEMASPLDVGAYVNTLQCAANVEQQLPFPMGAVGWAIGASISCLAVYGASVLFTIT